VAAPIARFDAGVTFLDYFPAGREEVPTMTSPEV
jgi:hypothetical protein